MHKSLLLLLQAVALAVCFHIVLAGRLDLSDAWGGHAGRIVDPLRAEVVLAVMMLYTLRLSLTLFWLLQRRVRRAEALGLGLPLMIFQMGTFLLAAGLTRRNAVPLGWLDGAAIALVLAGSYLNSYSEMQRKWWKDRPGNRGKCYTGGLFALARHINYFGDCLLFTGWCLLTAEPWTLAVPASMTLAFVLYHIPGLEAYLEQRYGEEFTAYKRRTKALVPLIY